MSLVVITSVPNYVSEEQHRALVSSTPSSFSDIPSILLYHEENISVVLDPPLQGFSEEDAATGTLYLLSSVLVFMSTSGKGFQVPYTTITLHAISRSDLAPSIYCQLDEAQAQEEEPTQDEEAELEMRELRIVPSTSESLEPIFEALSRCASMNPDPDSEDNSEFDDAYIDAGETVPAGNFEVFSGTEEEELSEVGRAALAHLESILVYPQPEHSDGETEQKLSNGVSS